MRFVPYFLVGPPAAIALSVGGTALALGGAGAMLAVLSGRHPVAGGGRMLLFGATAAVVTYAIGHLLGVRLTD